MLELSPHGMLFNSLTFIAFFAIVLALHYAPLPWRLKKVNLLIASYIFYGAWSPPFVLLLWLSTVLDWYVAKWLDQTEAPRRRRWLLFASMAGNLGMLGYFKYGGFLLENFTQAMGALGMAYRAPEWDIILPVGISFYTFQTMSYSLDVYFRRAKPARSFLDFALFVTFFPQLVAGPIVRPVDLIPQFASPRVASARQFAWGWMLIVLGLFQKIVLADGFLAPVVDKVYGAKEMLPALDAWLGTLAFSGQIFFDFAGYTTTAIGTALALGFSIPDNFRAPYAAIGFSDFWCRWHISLSSWLRDYLYIPLGGNRQGPGAHLCESDADDVAGRTLAWRRLDVRGLGRSARVLPVCGALAEAAGGTISFLANAWGQDRTGPPYLFPGEPDLGLFPRAGFRDCAPDAGEHALAGPKRDAGPDGVADHLLRWA